MGFQDELPDVRHNYSMLRDPSLIPLSHQHQHALALCVRIERAEVRGEDDLRAWRQEIDQIFAQEIRHHFAAEEAVLFPRAQEFDALITLVEELTAEHGSLRADFAAAGAGTLDERRLRDFAQRLAGHIRKEERRLFEELQKLLTGEELKELGRQIEEALKAVNTSCLLPNERTRLRPKDES